MTSVPEGAVRLARVVAGCWPATAAWTTPHESTRRLADTVEGHKILRDRGPDREANARVATTQSKTDYDGLVLWNCTAAC